MKTRTLEQNKVSVITLGCSKNLVDSENLITQLKGNDFDVQHDEVTRDTDIVIINTCGFIDLAKEESINTILKYAKVKSKGGIDKLYVTGCLSQRYKDNLEEEIPEVDAYFGTLELPRLLNTLEADYKHELVGERVLTTPSHYAYMKISEGCNRTCAFCAIPLMRGGHVSKPVEELVKEAKSLARIGVKEIILIAQELTYYGLDIYKKRALPDLLDALAEVEGIEWIRLQYAYPSKFPMGIIDAMKRHDKVCNYLDLPLQHASDKILQSMRRQITRDETKQLIRDIRQMIPGIAVRTTFIVGFPGETEEDFDQLCDFVREMRFERLGVFQYSHEEDTAAYEMEDDVPESIKAERANALMAIQQEISLELNQQKIGKIFKVLIDKKEGGYFYGRTEFDSVEVDNEVLIDASSNYCSVGGFCDVIIDDATEYDLIGHVIQPG
ncbi:MAG: 30S ribosomal protein S12 methylthiotransferase RimO [Saprospiraceae bacterium]|nr:30S ribosomal protein S12 methylthiotransferase RimO [Saprospiraceae bacterium]MBX7178961.1 30S ribosomal protein S12 methylthiotransferase RimO [Saprospiraceae bacterium]MCB0590666.1 30S ribosomal protein S12 methylthiotransferase RimO [Saprospiraceae bacterium]MCC7148415.1 30S ribosomal protein S12 methylthiotransferase RimO [Saprospiraceae bacterium]MCO5284685.1 30S ribosomal protein S12 methylthiotransferase RimO [Saprospiraceae bacterium]